MTYYREINDWHDWNRYVREHAELTERIRVVEKVLDKLSTDRLNGVFK